MKEIYRNVRRQLARLWLSVNLQLTVVGVTGSYGKTSAVNTIAQALSGKYSVNKTDDSLDTLYNLPITILKTKIWNEVLVLEYGIDHLREMEKHLSLVKPQIAVLTGITSVHTDKELLGSLDNVISEKMNLIKALPENGLAVFNFDDELVRKQGQYYKGRKMFYGLNQKADVWADKIELSLDQTKFILHDGKNNFQFQTKLLGYQAVYACLVAFIVAREKGVRHQEIILRLANLKPLKGRFSVEPGPMGSILVNDAKRANPVSTLVGLKSLCQLPGRKIVVLGEMGELGDSSKQMHQKIGEEVAKLPIDFLLGVGPLAKLMTDEAKKNGFKNILWAKDVLEASEILKKQLKKDDLLYLKASLLRHLERIVLLLEGKKVSCQEVICHEYHPCDSCSSLVQ